MSVCASVGGYAKMGQQVGGGLKKRASQMHMITGKEKDKAEKPGSRKKKEAKTPGEKRVNRDTQREKRAKGEGYSMRVHPIVVL